METCKQQYYNGFNNSSVETRVNIVTGVLENNI
jgi:hypothetical protein